MLLSHITFPPGTKSWIPSQAKAVRVSVVGQLPAAECDADTLSELLTITTHFHTHAHREVLEYDTSSLSPQNRSIAKALQHRSRISLGQSRQVLSDLSSAKDPASQAIKALAHQSLGNEKGVELAEELADKEGEDSVVQVVCGTILAAAGEYEKAVELLGKHQGNLEAYVNTARHLRMDHTRD